MNSFSAGFVSEALEYGLSLDEANHILKRAAEYPGMEPLTSSTEENNEDPSSMEVLKELMHQDAIAKNFGGYKQKINI